ncbi:MAG: UDP-N-acetylmuramoyl-tripeptide--D-alanyl-D-alanine ligase [Candidatus Sedimenticola endophacoides]
MICFNTADLAEGLRGTRLGEEATFGAVSTDTRTLCAGDLFVAIKGPTFDGHDYVGEARERGAAAALVQRDVGAPLPRVLVPDTRLGLGALAAMWRERSGVPLVAVTGSNGKTTVKEMLAAILRESGSSVLATRGNLNNDIGLPLTLTGLQDERYAVVEMGANHPGEIAYLTRIARPDVALLNNAGRAHLEGFGSLEGVARAKAEIIQGLAPQGWFVFNADDPWAPLWRGLDKGCNRRTFGIAPGADVRAVDVGGLHWGAEGFVNRFQVHSPQGEVGVELRLAGRHNLLNALAAIAAAQLVGADLDQIRRGLAAVTPVRGRLQPRAGRNGVTLIDDSYNANPDSVAAAIEVLGSAPGRRILILGGLAELGGDAERFYAELGERARAAGIERLYGVGAAGIAADSFGAGGYRFAGREALIGGLDGEFHRGDKVLIKGSRSAGMERVVEVLMAPEGD